jgi:hypothetical protein
MLSDHAQDVRPVAQWRPQWHFKAAGHYVPKATAECFRRHGFHVAEILLNWPSIAGQQLAQYSMPVRIKWPRRSTAGAEADDSQARTPQRTSLELWVDGGRALDVQYGSKGIIDRINTYFGYNAITELRILQGPVRGEESGTGPQRAAVRPSPRPACDEAKGVQHAPLREALGRLGASVRAGR